MLYWTLVFLVISLVAGALGFFGVAGTAAEIARVLFVIFIVLFVVALVAGQVELFFDHGEDDGVRKEKGAPRCVAAGLSAIATS